MPLCSVTQSLTLSVFANLLIYIIFILKSLNRPISGCHRALFQYLLPLRRNSLDILPMLGISFLVVLEYPSRWDKNRYMMSRRWYWTSLQAKGQTVGYQCTGKDLRRISNVLQCFHCNLCSLCCGVGMQDLTLHMFVAAEHPSGIM